MISAFRIVERTNDSVTGKICCLQRSEDTTSQAAPPLVPEPAEPTEASVPEPTEEAPASSAPPEPGSAGVPAALIPATRSSGISLPSTITCGTGPAYDTEL